MDRRRDRAAGGDRIYRGSIPLLVICPDGNLRLSAGPFSQDPANDGIAKGTSMRRTAAGVRVSSPPLGTSSATRNATLGAWVDYRVGIDPSTNKPGGTTQGIGCPGPSRRHRVRSGHNHGQVDECTACRAPFEGDQGRQDDADPLFRARFVDYRYPNWCDATAAAFRTDWERPDRSDPKRDFAPATETAATTDWVRSRIGADTETTPNSDSSRLQA